MTHGFTWTKRDGFHAVDDPHGHGTTTINGVNSAGDPGRLLHRQDWEHRRVPRHPGRTQMKTSHLQSMRADSVTFGMGSGGVTCMPIAFHPLLCSNF